MIKIVIFMLLFASSTLAQVIPDSAQALLYFPHLADGGPPSQRWQTILTFTNTNPNPASVLIAFFQDNGGSLNIDFGSGPSGQFTFVIPANGSRIFRSQIGSQTTTAGWAIAAASLPVQGTVGFLEIANGVPQVEITANSTLPTLKYYSAANPKLSIALANRHTNVSVSVLLQAVTSEGALVGQQAVTLPPLGHMAFTLIQEIPSLASDFSGTVILTGSTPQDTFVAWTLHSDASTGSVSSLPEGRLSLPISQYDRIWRVFERVLESAQANFPAFGLQPVTLQVSYSPTINASANGNTVTIYMALAELISDSESELGFAIAHELGHVYQFRLGGVFPFNPDPEFDADIFGASTAIGAGYDPYAAAGTLAKLAMVTGQAGLVSQFENQLSSDAHKSFNQRLDNIFTTITTACAPAPSICALYKSVYHPDFPSTAPLVVRPR